MYMYGHVATMYSRRFSGGFVLQTKGRPRPSIHFSGFFYFCQITPLVTVHCMYYMYMYNTLYMYSAIINYMHT